MIRTFATSLILLAGSNLVLGQKTIELNDFQALKVYDKIPVELIHSDTPKVEINGSLAEKVVIEQDYNELKIKLSGIDLLQGDNTQIVLYYTTLNDIQASQGSRIESEDVLGGESLKLTSNEGSTIKLKIDTNSLSAKLNSGGNMILSGQVKKQDVIVNTGAQFESKNLVSSFTNVTCNAGGHAWVHAKDKVDAKVRAGGVIRVYGNPSHKKQKKIAGGSIQFN
ncbi:head GIN domain-containing protein [Weeksella virosa]|uniref:Putative auto-transporter adhesin head GIN domain-containing protein n=1 Tax=Weeksella virosa (strain ATCC 43766 / DSM 16922 / JCM 21250 / CCUG 30538 / CDC 9751 / IAM 14551 / NBRC 16016 / NCTC 11634 / CL345/78) TaxID=865938 RepID=F0NYI3_WEEVC|nr:head GIN domain-containing protein [Weeksella virosa]ADX67103.1 hypothetical protein Weevi_0384 [Weeksella virosa DSM 16922]VEH63160.1 Protein of uncharacterised function (DUF2807) [Weeksella virosa]